MGNPHNKARYGETWNQDKIDVCLRELEYLKAHVVLSGGWAWHFLSPLNHAELKHAHDHKDIDIFVKPAETAEVINLLLSRGFYKTATRFDKLPSNTQSFRRYEKVVDDVKVIIDFFVKDIPFVELDGWRVVEPSELVKLYSSIHTSTSCFAVVAAQKMLKKGINIIHRNELMEVQ